MLSATKTGMILRCRHSLILAGCAGAIFFLASEGLFAASKASKNQARVTRIIRDVKLLPSKAEPKPAALNDQVKEGTGVRTGSASRSELTFVDLTITRLGENSVFSFNKGGRNVELNGGSMLLRVPKDSGGANISTTAVTVAITGTTLILESTPQGRNKLTVLEGASRIALKKYPKEAAYVLAGQTIDVPPGATKLPAVTNTDVDQVMKRNPLVTDFAPLPSRDLIYALKPNPAPNQESSGPSIIPSVVGNLFGLVPAVRTHSGGVQTGGGRGQPHTDHANSAHPGRTKTTKTGSKQSNVTRSSSAAKAHPSPTPTKRKTNNP